MIQAPKSSSTYASDVLAALQQTGVNMTSAGGKARAFSDSVGTEISGLESRMFANLSASFLPYATGDELDYIGQMYGITRLAASDASVYQSDNNFEFYVNTGNFGNINGGNDINIPAGTLITTSAGTAGVSYVVQTPITLPANSSSVYFAAETASTGSSGNAAQGVFTQTNFTNYVMSPYGSLQVTNNYGITSGTDQETDADFSYRINLALISRGGNSQTDIRYALLSIPGIQDVAFGPLAGTFNVYIYSVASIISPATIALAQTTINDQTAYPLIGLAFAPDLIGISLVANLTLTSGLSSTDISSIVSSAQTAASTYISNLGIGGELVINQIADAIQNSDTRILDVGSPNQPLNSIFIWMDRADGTRYSRNLANDFTPDVGQRIVVEPSITTPIQITTS